MPHPAVCTVEHSTQQLPVHSMSDAPQSLAPQPQKGQTACLVTGSLVLPTQYYLRIDPFRHHPVLPLPILRPLPLWSPQIDRERERGTDISHSE